MSSYYGRTLEKIFFVCAQYKRLRIKCIHLIQNHNFYIFKTLYLTKDKKHNILYFWDIRLDLLGFRGCLVTYGAGDVMVVTADVAGNLGIIHTAGRNGWFIGTTRTRQPPNAGLLLAQRRRQHCLSVLYLRRIKWAWRCTIRRSKRGDWCLGKIIQWYKKYQCTRYNKTMRYDIIIIKNIHSCFNPILDVKLWHTSP